MIRTAIPFGYLFIALFLLAGFVVGVGIFIWGWRRRSRGARWLGCGLVFIVIAVAVANIWMCSALEWNPIIRSDAEVAGTWRDRDQRLALSGDKTFTYRTPSQTTSGTWTRDDWNLYLRGMTQ